MNKTAKTKIATIINYPDGSTSVQCLYGLEKWEREALLSLPGFYECLCVEYVPDPTHKICVRKMGFLNELDVMEELNGKEIDGMIYQSTDPEAFIL